MNLLDIQMGDKITNTHSEVVEVVRIEIIDDCLYIAGVFPGSEWEFACMVIPELPPPTQNVRNWRGTGADLGYVVLGGHKFAQAALPRPQKGRVGESDRYKKFLTRLRGMRGEGEK